MSCCPLLVATLGTLLAQVSAAQQQTFTPWFYEEGHLVWDRHQFFEDNANTVYALAFDFLSVPGEPQARPDALLFNHAQFDPPEGMPCTPGKRTILMDSVENKGLQLYVNYSGAPTAPGAPQTYLSPTFFLALGHRDNPQTSPPLATTDLTLPRISATRGAMGVVQHAVQRHARVPFLHEAGADLSSVNAVYVTAGVGYGPSAFDPNAQPTWDEVCTDVLMVRDAAGVWSDQSSLVPLAVRQGNSSGCCFADFDGDADMDLFVGKPGDDYKGAQNRLLLFQGGAFVDVTATHLPSITDATVDVAAYDINLDGFQDVVVANRARRDGLPAGNEALDHVLVNDGSGHFTAVPLAHGVFSDTRSVAVGQLDGKPGPEIVLGNAGSDGFSNDPLVPAGDDHKMQIFHNAVNYPALALADDVDDYIDPAFERTYTGPFTQQVLLADLFSESDSNPDGRLDLFIVNQRDILKNEGPSAGNVRILVQGSSALTRRLIDFDVRDHLHWAKTIALGNFTSNESQTGGTLDLLVGTGNRFSGYDSYFFENLGGSTSPPWNMTDAMIAHLSYEAMPGNERGYGFDFADIDRDGLMDALQTARAYDYFVTGIAGGGAGGHADLWHRNLTGNASPFVLSNMRGRLSPIGMEDGVFADFDGDGQLDALMASQTGSSGTHPFGSPEVPDTILLRGSGTQFDCDVKEVPALYLGTPPPDTTITVDKRISLGGREAADRPRIADRAVAGDLDNDGDVDAIVHLFQINDPSSPQIPLVNAGNNFNLAPSSYSFGWRYLKNVFDPAMPNRAWLVDVAATQMVDAHGNTSLDYWNRGLGMDVLGDFDNNGALDLCSTVAPGSNSEATLQDLDRLFLNGVNGRPIGTLSEMSDGLLPRFILNPGLPNEVSLRTICVVQGDIDNDGYADLFAPKYERLLNRHVGLFMNHLGTGAAFTEEFRQRVPHQVGTLDTTVIHSDVIGSEVLDKIGFASLFDFDADGDLDLVYAVKGNVPRFLRNRGLDANQDGLIDAADNTPVGKFEDVTPTMVARIRPVVDSVETQAVDLDGDGDLDFAINCFDDEVVLWRNDLASDPVKPAVTEAWPRVGAIQGATVELHGVHLDQANMVMLVYRNGITLAIRSLTPIDDRRLSFRLPVDAPLGLAQVRVRRRDPATNAQVWSTQYFGYCVLDAP